MNPIINGWMSEEEQGSGLVVVLCPANHKLKQQPAVFPSVWKSQCTIPKFQMQLTMKHKHRPLHPLSHLSSCSSQGCSSQLVGAGVRLRQPLSVTVLNELEEELDLLLVTLN